MSVDDRIGWACCTGVVGWQHKDYHDNGGRGYGFVGGHVADIIQGAKQHCPRPPPRNLLFFQDSVRNIEAGKRVGLDTVLVKVIENGGLLNPRTDKEKEHLKRVNNGFE
ncbi:hypothetical protein PIB30_029525 [Stylosanthes scabra]|uniref:Uncharacterized protein n=1 Tax=Stylosanthes scabra TaxID=79078 RepID=A0ABU6UCB9_9FABA|nr:hypothetical protein [Stylosanthes scabra]